MPSEYGMSGPSIAQIVAQMLNGPKHHWKRVALVAPIIKGITLTRMLRPQKTSFEGFIGH